MRRIAKLLLVGIVFHAVYIASIFDIYFRTPLVHGMDPVYPVDPAPAKRLVLLVADGLRADKLFEHGVARAPFLREKVEGGGTWGVSHTRVPTESRPGHVAIIAGFYEDVSAVTKGWKMNPVDFDSVFNRTHRTWSFGSPDILPMFAKGASDPHRVKTYMYGAEEEDFGTEASHLDTWVFDHVAQLFQNASTDAALDAELRHDHNVLFLHLLGLDTNGHGHRPMSPEYLANIGVVDRGIAQLVDTINAFYGDDRTAYVFTADHGMHDRGNHGDGDPQNTETPLITWGAGVARQPRAALDPLGRPTARGHEPQRTWDLGAWPRLDVHQADIAPLMAALIGTPIPVNSAGRLPVEYLDLAGKPAQQARLLFQNALQLTAQYRAKAKTKRHMWFFHPYPLDGAIARGLSTASALIERDPGASSRTSRQVMTDALEGMRYYQTYDWALLRGVVSAGYLGWIVYTLLFILEQFAGFDLLGRATNSDLQRQHQRRLRRIQWITGFLSVSAVVFLTQRRAVWLHYVYAAFPIYFWSHAFKKQHVLQDAVKHMHALSTAMQKRDTVPRPRALTGSIGQTMLVAFAYLVALELLVVSYFRRDVLFVCFAASTFIWHHRLPAGLPHRRTWLSLWAGLSLTTGLFTLLPVEKADDLWLVTLGGFAVIGTALYMMWWQPQQLGLPEDAPGFLYALVALNAITIALVNHTAAMLRAKQGLAYLNQYGAWLCLAAGLAAIIDDGRRRPTQHYRRRLLVLFLGFAPAFILLSLTYEVIFYWSFSSLLLVWVQLERLDAAAATGHLAGDTLDAIDLRIAAFFLFAVNMAFFGTGNVASLSSFSLSSVYRFTTVFDPFLMSVLLLYKILIPFFLLSAVLGVLSRSLRLPPFSLFLLVVGTTDVMTLNFFFLVRDDGSWLEIGTSISHFVIASAFIILQIILFSLSHVLVGRVLIPAPTSRASKWAKQT
ncbi:hypothetical protein CXG81DRAFT_9583 [Caulochytrium protostelioides]|uniref:GPI ethanolamine phosphate transferase 1 n=1 Tax=Caulochytrium protostelioides TaxID=1555241 RepID=A0A4P9XE84_9FUNG|nr:PigN-domain-containing protein [Caulochytrium protostelioides]RKP03451.1 hypothetical protein CXG81DRAFT_9583 [Caulochytrium protostelioides]|eukprot:RKP03451.1 hypothetical protein CXG81DRAFT_9583 [Caulochytrium protostelioides]